jgi:hypothetical protein
VWQASGQTEQAKPESASDRVKPLREIAQFDRD